MFTGQHFFLVIQILDSTVLTITPAIYKIYIFSIWTYYQCYRLKITNKAENKIAFTILQTKPWATKPFHTQTQQKITYASEQRHGTEHKKKKRKYESKTTKKLLIVAIAYLHSYESFHLKIGFSSLLVFFFVKWTQ